MGYKYLKLSVLFLTTWGVMVADAQKVISTAGGNVSGSQGSVSYTVGQVVYEAVKGSNGSVTVGVQQPYEISTVSGTEQAKGISLIAHTYPNPTTDYLMLKVEDSEFSSLQYQLYDMQGKMLQQQKITSGETSIQMGRYPPATYLLKITNNNQEITTFKIIKK